MGENSAIEWCDHTFNPWIGCTKVSPACDNCYAEALATRRLGIAWGPHAKRRRTAESTWRQPLAWNRKAEREGKRARVFCASLADVFDNAVLEDWRVALWRVIHQTPHMDWLLLTKRPQNITRMLPQALDFGAAAWARSPWPNVWLGTTVESREEMLRRGPLLRGIPAARRFWSAEPLLGDLGSITAEIMPDWIIAGGESGPSARPSHPDWFRSLRDQCAAADVPFFFKQHGDWREFNHRPEIETVDSPSDAADAIAAVAHRPAWVAPDGQFFRRQRDLPEGVPCRLVEQLGKRAAGAVLDGREHREVPHA